jgi:hypothetical protein
MGQAARARRRGRAQLVPTEPASWPCRRLRVSARNSSVDAETFSFTMGRLQSTQDCVWAACKSLVTNQLPQCSAPGWPGPGGRGEPPGKLVYRDSHYDRRSLRNLKNSQRHNSSSANQLLLYQIFFSSIIRIKTLLNHIISLLYQLFFYSFGLLYHIISQA